jgi:ferredoxin-type protein NapH
VKLKNARKIAQVAAFAVSNLGLFRVLKTGFVCPFLYCHGCPFAAFGCPIGVLQHFIIDGQFPLFAIGSLGALGIFSARAFCGWACPFGTLHDMLSPTNRRRDVKTKNHWFTKYIVLFLALILAWFALDTIFCKFCPSGSLFAAIPFRLFYPGFAELGLFFYIHMFTLASTVFLALLVSRFWCRYLCPLGAIAGAFNKVGILTIQRDKEKCKECNSCLNMCTMGIKKTEEIGTSTDCILCGRCVEACPEKALSFKMRG